MFVALDTKTGKRIISLDPGHSDESLRQYGRSGGLSCPECRQLVIFRAGSGLKRRHFAHKQLADCPLEYERPEIVEGRAVLYEWVITKFPTQVQIEHRPADGACLPRPIDVLVTLPEDRLGAFWIFDTSIRDLEARKAIWRYFADSPSTSVTWIFLSTMLKTVPNNSAQILLSKMERDFTVRTQYDQVRADFDDSDGTLHYLDSEGHQLTTFRRLRRIHVPNVYIGDMRTSRLTTLLMQSKAWEIAHRGEYETMMRFRNRLQNRRVNMQNAALHPPPSVKMSSASLPKSDKVDYVAGDHSSVRREPVNVRCRICGKMKREAELLEWVRGRGEGTCRSCMRRND